MLKIEFDCHLHTTRSACGENMTDEWLRERALENGLRFCVTDHSMHLYYEPELAWAMMGEDGIRLFEERKQSGRDNILRYIEEIRSCEAENMQVGMEVDVQPDGQIMFPEDVRGGMDLLVGALHYMPTIKQKAGPEEVEEEFRRQTVWLLDWGVDVLAHPCRIMLHNKREVSRELMRWVVEQAAAHDTAVEINSHYPFDEHDELMIRDAVELNVPLATGTDAHNSRDFGQFDYHRRLLAAAGLSEDEAAARLFVGRRAR